MPLEISLTCKKCGKSITAIISTEPRDPFRCPNCGDVPFKLRNVPGYIYILSNAEMSGLLKIGFTSRSVSDRVYELSSATGVPTAFTIEAHFESLNPKADENAIHRLLAQNRVPGREFFRVTLEEAITAVSSVTGTEPTGFAKGVAQEAVPVSTFSSSTPFLWRCRKCSAEFLSGSGLCPRCGGSGWRLNWGR
jgi:Zn finger protein HypA/HybF involved in hydrogenase expression